MPPWLASPSQTQCSNDPLLPCVLPLFSPCTSLCTTHLHIEPNIAGRLKHLFRKETKKHSMIYASTLHSTQPKACESKLQYGLACQKAVKRPTYRRVVVGSSCQSSPQEVLHHGIAPQQLKRTDLKHIAAVPCFKMNRMKISSCSVCRKLLDQNSMTRRNRVMKERLNRTE